jgi:hypothetical protein
MVMRSFHGGDWREIDLKNAWKNELHQGCELGILTVPKGAALRDQRYALRTIGGVADERGEVWLFLDASGQARGADGRFRGKGKKRA